MHHGQEIFMNIPIPKRRLKCNTKTILVHMVTSFLTFLGLHSKVVVKQIGMEDIGGPPWF